MGVYNNTMNKICKRKECKNICAIPSWIYCSDECNRLSLNSRNLIAQHKYKMQKKYPIIISDMCECEED